MILVKNVNTNVKRKYVNVNISPRILFSNVKIVNKHLELFLTRTHKYNSKCTN